MEAAKSARRAAKLSLRALKASANVDKKVVKAARRAYTHAKTVVDKLESNERCAAAAAAVKAGKRPRTRSISDVGELSAVTEQTESNERCVAAAAVKAGKRPRTRSISDAAIKEASVVKKPNAHKIFESFSETPFRKGTLDALSGAGFKVPTEIQSKAWPIVLGGADLTAVAKTGSGKTLGFLLPALHSLSGTMATGNERPSPRALVCSPTRELTIQIAAEAHKFAGGVSIACLYGGTPVTTQIRELREKRPALVVVTPGRLADLLDRRSLSLACCTYVVLDEADRMLDMGFEPQITKIFAALPKQRQTLFFTATWPKNVRKLASKFLRDDAVEIFIGNADADLEANRAITQRFVQATDDEKDRKLYDVLCKLPEDGARVVIFCNTKRRCDCLHKTLWADGWACCAVHGDKDQRERAQNLRKFASGEINLLIATDVAARGLDIKPAIYVVMGVTAVVNFDMARDVESYVHRIGRTGRAGELGDAVTFWNPDYDKPCSAALAKIARDAGQAVPDWLAKFESTKAPKAWRKEKAVLPPM